MNRKDSQPFYPDGDPACLVHSECARGIMEPYPSTSRMSYRGAMAHAQALLRSGDGYSITISHLLRR